LSYNGNRTFDAINTNSLEMLGYQITSRIDDKYSLF